MKELHCSHNKKFELYEFEVNRVCVECFVFMQLVVISQLVFVFMKLVVISQQVNYLQEVVENGKQKNQTNKDYCRAYHQEKGDLYKANDAARKKMKEKEGNILSQKCTKCSR